MKFLHLLNSSKPDVLYFDNTTKQISYGPTPSASSSEITDKLASDANSTYADNSSYWSKIITTDGWTVNGILTGTRKGIEHTQRIQDITNANTYARVWLNGSSAWGAWSLYLDSSDFTAKGQTHFASAANAAGVLPVGANNEVLTADSTQALGVKWTALGLKQIIASNIKISNTGNTTENIVYTGTIPANSIGVNGFFQIRMLTSALANNANAKTFRIKFNGTTIATSSALASNLSARLIVELFNRNSLSSQIGGAAAALISTNYTSSTVAFSNFTFNTAADITLTVTILNAVGTDTSSLESIQVIGIF
jgi:hypothetical protein